MIAGKYEVAAEQAGNSYGAKVRQSDHTSLYTMVCQLRRKQRVRQRNKIQSVSGVREPLGTSMAGQCLRSAGLMVNKGNWLNMPIFLWEKRDTHGRVYRQEKIKCILGGNYGKSGNENHS